MSWPCADVKSRPCSNGMLLHRPGHEGGRQLTPWDWRVDISMKLGLGAACSPGSTPNSPKTLVGHFSILQVSVPTSLNARSVSSEDLFIRCFDSSRSWHSVTEKRDGQERGQNTDSEAESTAWGSPKMTQPHGSF